MRSVEILSLPEIAFSHIYKADSYCNSFRPKENFMEITYIASGSLTYQVGNRSIVIKKGDVICASYRTAYSIESEGAHSHHTVAARFRWDFCDTGRGLLLPHITPAENNTASICRLIDDFVHNPVLYKTNKAKGAAKFLELLCAIDQCNRKSQSSNLPGELLYADQAKDYIQKNIHAPITQAAVADHLGISPEYLCAVFKKAEDTTIMRYINRIKLENIKSLMDNTNLRLYGSSAMYGYSDPNYVSRLYKQIFGYNITDKPRIYPKIE